MQRQGPPVASAAVSSVVTAAPGSGPADASAADQAPTRSRRPSPDVLAALLIAAAIVALAMISAGGVDNVTATPGQHLDRDRGDGARRGHRRRRAGDRPARPALGNGDRCADGRPDRARMSPRSRGHTPPTARGWPPARRSPTWRHSPPPSSWHALAPGRWRALLGGFAIAMTVLCGWSLLVKVFPSTLASIDHARSPPGPVRVLERDRAVRARSACRRACGRAPAATVDGCSPVSPRRRCVCC